MHANNIIMRTAEKSSDGVSTPPIEMTVTPAPVHVEPIDMELHYSGEHSKRRLSAPPSMHEYYVQRHQHQPTAKRKVSSIIFPDAISRQAVEQPRVRDLFLKTDLHGLPDLYNNYQQRRAAFVVIWLLIVGAAVALLVWQIVETWNDFADNPILTTYSVVSRADGIPFPVVYICPYNRIHQKVLESTNIDPKWYKENARTLLADDVRALNDSVLKARARLNEVIVTSLANQVFGAVGGIGPASAPGCPPDNALCGQNMKPWVPRDVQEFLMRVGIPRDTLFEECAFASTSVPCADYVREVFDANYGKCFAVDMRRRQLIEGGGLSLVLNVDTVNATLASAGPFDMPQADASIFDGVLVKVLINLAHLCRERR